MKGVVTKANVIVKALMKYKEDFKSQNKLLQNNQIKIVYQVLPLV